MCIHISALLQCAGLDLVSKMLSAQQYIDPEPPFQAELSPLPAHIVSLWHCLKLCSALLQRAGLDIEKLLMCQPDSGEMALEIVDQMVRSQAVDIICVDSVAALIPRAEIEGEIGNVQGECIMASLQALKSHI